MRNYLLFLLFLLTSGTALAQSPSIFTVKGVLVDSLTNEGEPFATIRIVNKNTPNKAVKMGVTRNDGRFQETLSTIEGRYVLTITSIGKTTVVKEFAVSSKQKKIDLGTLYTTEATNQLKGVEIVAQKSLVKVDVDKIEYNIEDDPDAKTNSVLEMLRKVPLVTVDGEDNIQVNGSSSFKVHVNGKPNTMMSNNPKDILKSMPASSIKHIEVITSPGAKYDAEGVGGILNIVTVGGGFEGYTANVRSDVRNDGFGLGGYATVKKGKLTVSGNYNYYHRNSPTIYSSSYRENYNSDSEKYLESDRSFKSNGEFQHGNLEASYEIDSLRLLSMSFGIYGGANNSKPYGTTTMYNSGRIPVYGYNSAGVDNGSWYSVSGNIDYQRVSKKNKQRMVTLSYRINSNPQTGKSSSVYTDITPEAEKTEIVDRLNLSNYRSNNKQNTIEHTFQTDYTTPIGKYQTAEVGVKYIFRNNTSDDKYYDAKASEDVYKYNEDRSSKYEHLNQILSAYAGYTLRYKVLSFKPGLRYEHTKQNVKFHVGSGEDFNSSFNDLIPSVSLGAKIGKTQNLRLLYDMRISRPGIWFLNPYLNFNNQNRMIISQGNPDLKSEKMHSFDLSYSSFSAKFNLNLALRHSFGNNGIERISRLITADGGETIGEHVLPQGAIYSTYENTAKNNETGLNVYMNWNLSPKTRFYMNGRGSYKDIKSDGQNLHNYGWMGSAFCGIQHTLPLKLRLSLNGGGSTPMVSLQGKNSGYYFYSLSVNRSFLKEDRLTVSAFCGNVFEKYRSFNNTTIGDNFISKDVTKYPARRFGFSVSYRLGELKASVKKAVRSISNDDVKSGGDSSQGKESSL